MAHKNNCLAWDELEPAGGCPACGGTAPSQAATPMTPEERARATERLTIGCEHSCESCDTPYKPDCERVQAINAAAIRAAEVAKVNETLEKEAVRLDEHRKAVIEMQDKAEKVLLPTGEHAAVICELANQAMLLRDHKLPSPEKEVVGGRESKPARSDTDATKEGT